jgi:threonine dehydratase
MRPGLCVSCPDMIQLSDVQTALGRIRADIRVSPCPRSETFSAVTGNSIYLKMDNQQRTGAFKERGALNRILSLSSDERARGVIAASAGNHAQGVSYHAGRHGVRARIVMPLPTPLTKVSATRAYGAEVVLHGTNYDEAYEHAMELSQQDSLVLVHAFDDESVIAGQGTLGLEILQQHPDIEVIVSPIGGGGLIGGVACAVKESRPSVKVYGVQPSRIPSMKAAIAAGQPLTLD